MEKKKVRAPENEGRQTERIISATNPMVKTNPNTGATTLRVRQNWPLTQLLSVPGLSDPRRQCFFQLLRRVRKVHSLLNVYFWWGSMGVNTYACAYLCNSVPHRKEAEARVWRRQRVHQKLMKQTAFCPSVTCKTEKLCSILKITVLNKKWAKLECVWKWETSIGKKLSLWKCTTVKKIGSRA